MLCFFLSNVSYEAYFKSPACTIKIKSYIAFQMGVSIHKYDTTSNVDCPVALGKEARLSSLEPARDDTRRPYARHKNRVHPSTVLRMKVTVTAVPGKHKI